LSDVTIGLKTNKKTCGGNLKPPSFRQLPMRHRLHRHGCEPEAGQWGVGAGAPLDDGRAGGGPASGGT